MGRLSQLVWALCLAGSACSGQWQHDVLNVVRAIYADPGLFAALLRRVTEEGAATGQAWARTAP